jgi:hypothetical protein
LARHRDRINTLDVHTAVAQPLTALRARCPKELVYSRVPMEPDRSPLRAELDRVGASFAKAGAAKCISVQLGVDEVKLLGQPREHPRRSWLGPEWQALELLRALPDDAGVQAVWRALNGQ